MKTRASAEIVKQDMIRLCHSTVDAHTLRFELLQRLRLVIPFDYAYFSTTDPATQLNTGSVVFEEPPAWMLSLFLENEFLQEDFIKFGTLLRRRQAVGVLSMATRNELDRSQRYRDMLTPLAIGDELRAIFVTQSTCWGTLCLHRGRARSGYDPADAAFVAQIAPHVADGLRKSLLWGNVSLEAAPDAPGVLMLTDDLSTVSMTPAAEHWLAQLQEAEGENGKMLPIPVRSIVARLLALENGLRDAHLSPKCRLRTRSGQWLVIHASRLNREDSQQIAVIFELARPSEMAPLMMQVYQLTRREGEIAQCVLQGWSTTEIASRLHISANTVQDHLKAIFDKVGAGSRGELAARIFAQHYQARFVAGAALDAYGQFDTSDPS
ncbi:MAG: helix-turn-helix transcriptional regulator [Anaerolineae bacterium]|nr:helix-turn-helix transcriptional regulator [Anaerolineae bacterium]